MEFRGFTSAATQTSGRVVIFLFISLLFVCGCRTLEAPAKPSSFSVDKSEAEKSQQARNFAQSFAEQKKNENKQAAAIKPQLKPAESVKTIDPAWESIKKQKAKPEKPLTLVELIDIAFKNNPQLRQYWESARVARAIERQSESVLYPQLTISAAATREKQKGFFGNLSDLYYGPSAQLTYLILDFGGRNARIESTFQKVLEANSLYNQSIQDLILNVQTTYYTYYSAQSAVEAEELDVQNTKADYEASQQRFDVGLSPKLDVLQAKSNYEDSLYNLENAKGNLKTAKANLALAIGVPADSGIDIVSPVKELPTELNEDDVSRLIEESIQKRPDISALRAELNSKKSASRAASSDLLPSLNLGANAQQQKYRFYSSSGFNKNQYDYSGSLSLDWNIFDGFNNLYKKKQADYEANIALDNLMQAELEASSDVWVKYYNFYTAVQKLKYSESFFQTSQTSYDLALESYKAGLKSILDLISAQSSLSSARSRLIQSKQDVFITLAELAHSTGTPNIKMKLAGSSSRVKGE